MPGQFFLLSVGRLIPRKNLRWFVGAVMAKLPDRVVLLVLGDGAEREAIQGEVRRLGLEARVRLAGRVPADLRDAAYAGSDLFIMPNRPVEGDAEGFGIVNIEAASRGLPVIAAQLEGITEAVIDQANGCVVPAGDAEAFLKTIGYYLDHEAERQAFSQRAREYTNEHFDWAILARRYRAVYERVLNVKEEGAVE
jgi:phosphatidylinositol alpha-1,6-mannosyltransferase